MFDRQLTGFIKPSIERISRALAARNVSPNAVTSAGLAIGLAAALFIAFGYLRTGLFLILVSRLADGLDGAVARVSGGPTHLGGFLDIVFDFVFYGSIPLAFALLDPAQNAVAAAVLLLTFYANGGSVLAFAVMAERTGIDDEKRGGKSLMFTVGLMEGGETLLFFMLFCLLPDAFPYLAGLFAILTAWTFCMRVRLAFDTFVRLPADRSNTPKKDE